VVELSFLFFIENNLIVLCCRCKQNFYGNPLPQGSCNSCPEGKFSRVGATRIEQCTVLEIFVNSAVIDPGVPASVFFQGGLTGVFFPEGAFNKSTKVNISLADFSSIVINQARQFPTYCH
jgi:hypothetical protein